MFEWHNIFVPLLLCLGQTQW